MLQNHSLFIFLKRVLWKKKIIVFELSDHFLVNLCNWEGFALKFYFQNNKTMRLMFECSHLAPGAEAIKSEHCMTNDEILGVGNMEWVTIQLKSKFHTVISMCFPCFLKKLSISSFCKTFT